MKYYDEINEGINSFNDINSVNYEQIASDYGVEFPAFPEKTIFLNDSLVINDETPIKGEQRKSKSISKIISIPKNYKAVEIAWNGGTFENKNSVKLLFGHIECNTPNHHLVVNGMNILGDVPLTMFVEHRVDMGHEPDYWTYRETKVKGEYGFTLDKEDPDKALKGHKVYPSLNTIMNFTIKCVHIDDDGNNNPYGIDKEIFGGFDCEANWKRECYHILMNAYNQKQREYEDKLEQATFGKPVFGTNPNENAIIIKQELKRLFIEQITSQKFESFDAMQPKKGPNGYPEMCNEEALREGKYIQFIEQVFEYTNLTYLLYDYYWMEKETWADRINIDNPDPLFKKFLEAGYARVCLPVRPGYEEALATALATGKLPHEIENGIVMENPLFVSIAQIQQEQQGNSKKTPIGTPWEYKVPTNHVILLNKNENDLCMKKDKHPDLPCFSVNKEYQLDAKNEYNDKNLAATNEDVRGIEVKPLGININL